MSLTTYSTSQPADAAGVVDLVDHHLRGLRAGLIGERAEFAEVGGEADAQRSVERALAGSLSRVVAAIAGRVAVVSSGAVVVSLSSSSPQATARTLNDMSTTGMIRFLITSP